VLCIATDKFCVLNHIAYHHRASFMSLLQSQGAQFYLSEDIQITNGHIGFLQNPWALAAVSQTQFRPHLNLSNMGDGDTPAPNISTAFAY
jgi:hypothetical protein